MTTLRNIDAAMIRGLGSPLVNGIRIVADAFSASETRQHRGLHLALQVDDRVVFLGADLAKQFADLFVLECFLKSTQMTRYYSLHSRMPVRNVGKRFFDDPIKTNVANGTRRVLD